MGIDALTSADQLYDKVKSLIQDTKPLDENTARIIVESADDAIKEFGSTNQEKKIELKRWKAQAEQILPPDNIEEFRKRAERQLLQKTYLRHRLARTTLLTLLSLTVVGVPVAIFLRDTIKQDNKPQTPPYVNPDEYTPPSAAPSSSAAEETDPEIRRYTQELQTILRKRADKYRNRGKGKDLTDALADYTQALGLQTDELDRAEVRLERGNTYLQGDDWFKANTDFSEGLKLIKDSNDEKPRRLVLDLLLARGLGYEKHKSYRKAYDDLTNVCYLDRDSLQCDKAKKIKEGWDEVIWEGVLKTYRPL
jgi:tetratricopeptide (TPR) repeat protein